MVLSFFIIGVQPLGSSQSPREVRETYGIKPLDEIEIVSIEPAEALVIGGMLY